MSGGRGIRGAHAPTRAIRRLLIAYLACTLVGRMVDANPHPDGWYIVGVAACFVLPVWFLSGRLPGPWVRMPWLLLAVQAAVTLVPFAVFGAHWVAGVDGLLGALVLLVLPVRVRWMVLPVAVAVEVAAWLIVGPPGGYWTNFFWVPLAYLNTALGVFGIATARTLLERLESTGEVLADAAVDQQRLATAQRLRDSILRRLDDIRERAGRASRSTGAASTSELEQMGRAAREAATEARGLATALPDAPSPAVEPSPISPRVATGVVIAVTVIFAIIFVENSLLSTWSYAPEKLGTGITRVGIIAADLGIAVAMVLLQLRHLRPRGGRRPRSWGASLAAQVVLCGALYPVFGPTCLLFLPYVGSSAFLLLRGPLRWVVAAAAVLALPAATLIRQDGLGSFSSAMLWTVYGGATDLAAVLLFVGLGRFADAAAALAGAVRLVAQSAATRERVRISRDTHDTLGLTLSTIALKSDLAVQLAERDPQRAHREILQAMHLAHTASADAASIVTGTLALELATELAAARDALTAGGIEVAIDDDLGPVGGEVETQLAAVLREAVANILRHTDARRCTIALHQDGGVARIEIANDGARPADRNLRPGQGIANMRSRVAALGGEVVVERAGGDFALRIRVPVDAAVDREDARRDPAAAR
jgi:two-component system, NarL family, sensor histidine kinase DesK